MGAHKHARDTYNRYRARNIGYNSAVARYERIAERVARDIRAGLLPPGSRLPSLRALCEREGVSLMTALAAYRRLEAQRLVSAEPRSGYRVSRATAERLAGPAIARARVHPPRNPRSTILGEVLLAASNPELVPLGLACPDPSLFPLGSLRRMTGSLLAADPSLWACYALPPGDARLRTAIARRLSARGARVSPEQVLITAGAMEALTLAVRCLTRPGDLVAVECPTFFGILDLVKSMGVGVLELPTDPVLGIDPARLDDACRKHRIRAAVLMPNIANPTGAAMDADRRRELARVLDRRGIVAIEDDIYAELSFDRRAPSPLFAERRDVPFVLAGSLSKTLLPAGRVGYVVAEAPWIERLVEAKRVSTLANPTLSERLAAECLESGMFDRHLRRLAPRLEEAVRRLADGVARHFPPGTRATDPRGGFMLWVELPEGCDGERMFWAARDAGIGIVPGTVFSLAGGLERFVRLSGGTDPRTDRALETLGRLARAQL
jgi:DNA-binding transcriptional MocR family regulator